MTYIAELAAAVRAALPEAALPEHRDIEQLCALYALLIQVRGTTLDAEAVHDAWSTWMTIQGESHASVRPFKDLDESTRREDDPFLNALLKVARAQQGA